MYTRSRGLIAFILLCSMVFAIVPGCEAQGPYGGGSGGESPYGQGYNPYSQLGQMFQGFNFGFMQGSSNPMADGSNPYSSGSGGMYWQGNQPGYTGANPYGDGNGGMGWNGAQPGWNNQYTQPVYQQPAYQQPVYQQPAYQNSGGTNIADPGSPCYSYYAASVGNPNVWRNYYQPFPGDEFMCTPQGWVAIQ